jgi:hypothetical protein
MVRTSQRELVLLKLLRKIINLSGHVQATKLQVDSNEKCPSDSKVHQEAGAVKKLRDQKNENGDLLYHFDRKFSNA